MALFTDATEILDNGNNKQVKKIEDSNGDIIWGSPSAYPYRRLEYVITDGTAAINTGVPSGTQAGNPTLIKCKLMTTSLGTQQRVVANYAPVSLSSVNRRYAIVVNESGLFKCNIGNSWKGTKTCAVNTVYEVETSLLYNNYYIDVDGSKETFANASSVGTTGNHYYGYGAGVNVANTPVFESGFIGRLYDLTISNSDSSNRWDFIPVQRKSDNAIGFVRITKVNGSVTDTTFMPSTWTNPFTAGPVVDEYWDLTTPS